MIYNVHNQSYSKQHSVLSLNNYYNYYVKILQQTVEKQISIIIFLCHKTKINI